MHSQNLAVLFVRHNFNEPVVAADDAGLGVRGERELAYLHFVALLLGLRLGQSYAANLWVAVGSAGNQVAFHWTRILARDFGYNDHSLHGSYVRKLGHAHHNVANRINARLHCLHPLICGNEAAFGFDFRLVESHVFSLWGAPDGDENLLGFELLLLAIGGGEGYRSAVFGLLNLLDLC